MCVMCAIPVDQCICCCAPQALAQADKERADRERGEAKATATPATKTAKSKDGGAADEETPQKAPRAKSAYQVRRFFQEAISCHLYHWHH